jgi:hypothetical protein
MGMYSFVPPFREATFCGVLSCVFDKSGCAAGEKRLWNTALHKSYVGFEVLRVVKMMILLFWVVMPCALIGRYEHFGETQSLHLQG